MTTQANTITLRRFMISLVSTIFFFPAFTLLLGGNLFWPEGWIFSLWVDAMIVSSMVYLYLKDPALLAERSKAPGSENQKKWDVYLLTFFYFMAIVWFIIMPLDAERFGWSPVFPLWLKVIGGLTLLPSLYFIYQATAQNTFMSTMVRIQNERNQRVISSGVYGFVRHPLYLGCVLMIFGGALLLGSIYGIIIGIISIIALVIRIGGEETMLTTELEGYEDYKRKVRYRLVPFIW